MKKSAALLVLFSFGMLFTTPISAQRKFNLPTNQNFEKVSVKYKSIDAYSDGNGVWLEWETTSENGNLGFNIYRAIGGEKIVVSQNLVPGNYLKTGDAQTVGEKYSFFDAGGDYNSSYYIETFSTKGQKQLSGLISPKIVADLTEFAGSSSADLKSMSRSSNGIITSNETDLPEVVKTQFIKSLTRSDAIKQRFVAAQAGVKIGVKKDGFYRISRAELQNGGFDSALPFSNWQLYKNGVEQPINVGANGDFIEFYGKGVDNRDTDTQIYFLTSGAQNGKRIEPFSSRAFGVKFFSNSFSQTLIYKERTIYGSDIFNGDDAENFFGRVITNTPTTIDLNLSAVDFSVPNASIDLKIQGATQVQHQTKVLLNNVEVGTVDGSSKNSAAKHFDIQTSILKEGQNSLQLSSQAGSSDISFLDTIKVNYPKKYAAQQNQLQFFIPGSRAGYVNGFSTSNVRVFDVTYPDQIKSLPNLNVESDNAGGFRAYISPASARVLFAVEDSALLKADSIVKNTPSTLSTAEHTSSMIIISYKDWMTEANTWADYRRSQGINVEVVNIEDVFDEFSFGAFSTDAIKGFLKYAYNNWQTTPKYVLLLGDATYNPRGYATGDNSGQFNFVPTKLIETIYLETGSDETMADFNNDGLAEIPIGRIPVHDAQTVIDVLNKVLVFEVTVAPQNLSRGVIFASDVPNGYNFQGVSERLRTHLSPEVNAVMVNKAETDSRTRLLAELNNGRYLINYSGHGNTGAWSASPTFFGVNDVPNMTNGDNLSVFTMLTCLNGYFIQPTDSLSEKLLKKPNGGAAAVWASTGLTTPDIQEIMATRFFNEINTSDASMRMGDLIKNAKTAIPAGRDVRLSWALIGDPALKMK